MENVKVDIAFGEYDRTLILKEGKVKIQGVDAHFHSDKIVTEIFAKMIRDRAYDVAEVGLSFFLRTMDLDDPPFLALPVFPNRCFRHSAIYINVHSGIRAPEDLVGKRIGELAMYGHDAGVWPKGILADDFGVRPNQCRWLVGALDWPLAPIDFVAQPHPADTVVEWAPPGTDLGHLLDTGEIDALISADVPKCVLEGSANVKRLFEDYETVERAYFERTGIFPMMHAMVIRRSLARAHPEVAQAVYEGFCAAKKAVLQQYVQGRIFNNMATMVPWLSKLVERDQRDLGEDWWPYGMRANRKAVDTFLRYHFEQGLSRRHMTCEDLFVSALLDT